jgi:hypothetical protein
MQEILEVIKAYNDIKYPKESESVKEVSAEEFFGFLG